MKYEAMYYCPKCNSINIEITCVNPPEHETISMDDIGNQNQFKTNDLVLRTYKYQAKCKNCGYIVEYQE